MKTIENIIRDIQRDLTPQFEQKLRQVLVNQDKDWLIEQVVRLTLDAHSLREMDRKTMLRLKAQQREERMMRVRLMALDEDDIQSFRGSYANYDRRKLIEEGFLLPQAPEKGTDLITPEYRTLRGNELLIEIKDTLFALLFGDETTNTFLRRIEQELLTITVPMYKSSALDFMKATTELSAYGTWQDPESVSNDMRADNTLLQVEYGEVDGEHVGHAIITSLSLINNLEINEQILYARMENIEQSTLIS